MAIKNYDPKNVHVSLSGIPLSGFADGTFVSISFESDAWIHESGSDGEEMRTKSNDNRATCTITLMESSASNDVLSGLYLADKASSAGAVPFMVKDNNGTTLVTAVSAWVRKMTDISKGRSGENREWTISLSDCVAFAGGLTAI